MGYYPEPDSHIRDKVKVVLDLSSYATKKDFIALIAEVDEQDITCILTSLNNLKTKVDDLNVGKLKTIPVNLKKCSR